MKVYHIFKITPVSPNTAALGLYGHTQVGIIQGTSSIDIPLYEVDWDGKEDTDKYILQASVIRVAKEASSIGLGWLLNLGGCITKTFNGEGDFYTSNGTFKSLYLII